MRGISIAAMAASFAVAWAAGCESARAPIPDAIPVPPADPAPSLDVVSGDRSWSDLTALAEIGPRVAGSPGAVEARAYLMTQLSAVAADVHEVETVRSRAFPKSAADATPPDVESLSATPGPRHEILTHVVGTLPGASPDLFVLVAPYDSSEIEGISFVGVNDGASGAALLLELARVLSRRALPYTTRFVFLEGEGRAVGLEGGERFSGSRSLAESMESAGELASVRVLIALNQVCDADLQIARDLGSHRMHREEFFKAAGRLGRLEAFGTGQTFESVDASHDAFRDRGVRGVVAILDTRFGGDQVPGLYADGVDDSLDHCAPGSLEAVGLVTIEALETIGRRLSKIDRFSRAPLSRVEAEASDIGGSPDIVPQPVEPMAASEPGPAPDSEPSPEPDSEPDAQ